MNNEWITDRHPFYEEGYIYNSQGIVIPAGERGLGEAWKPIPELAPYVKPKPCDVQWSHEFNCWMVLHVGRTMRYTRLRMLDKDNVEHCEAAKRIAAIYDEVMP